MSLVEYSKHSWLVRSAERYLMAIINIRSLIKYHCGKYRIHLGTLGMILHGANCCGCQLMLSIPPS